MTSTMEIVAYVFFVSLLLTSFAVGKYLSGQEKKRYNSSK